jgi:hypothetical protein
LQNRWLGLEKFRKFSKNQYFSKDKKSPFRYLGAEYPTSQRRLAMDSRYKAITSLAISLLAATYLWSSAVANARDIQAVPLRAVYKMDEGYKSPLKAVFFMTDSASEAQAASSQYHFTISYDSGCSDCEAKAGFPGLGQICPGNGYNNWCLGWVFPEQAVGTVPLYRYLNPDNGRHFFTTSHDEGQSAILRYGFVDEGICCFVSATQIAGTVPLRRLYGDRGGHFYTTSDRLGQWLELRENFRPEGAAAYIWSSPVSLPAP